MAHPSRLHINWTGITIFCSEVLIVIRFEELKAGGFLNLEEDIVENNEDLLRQIQEEEDLCAFYE